MKKNDYLLIAATAAYSFLFYEQTAGLNFLLFTCVLTGIFLARDNRLLRNRRWLWAAALSLISGASVFVNSSALSIIANCSSLMILSGLSVNANTSFIFSSLFSIYSLLSSSVFMIIDPVLRAQQRAATGVQRSRGWLRLLVVGIVLVLCIIFFFLYRAANPLFAENTKWINFDFISFAWVGFTLGGLLIAYGLFYHKTIPEIERWENRLPLENTVASEEESRSKRMEVEGFGGLLLFVILNLMLVVLNVGDIQTLYLRGGLPKGMSHSDFVHDGVNAMIFSIILAAALLMYVFRKKAPQQKHNKLIKALVYAWMLQNLLMLSSTMMRNLIYVQDCNLTYKRIGVFVWLGLAAIGIFLTFVKVSRERSNWYLVRSNFAVWFSALAFSSVVNWDVYLTRFNLVNKPLVQVDFVYLFSLSESNLPELMEITRHPKFRFLNTYVQQNPNPYNRQQNYYSDYNGTYLDMLSMKAGRYVRNHYGDWRSLDLQHQRIMNSITAQKH